MATGVPKFSSAAGEIAPRLWDRQDLAKQASAVKRAENVVVTIEGSLTRVSGTRFVAPLVNEERPALFVPFRFSEDDAYMLVLNGGVIQFYRSAGVVLDGSGAVYQVAHPFADSELDTLRWAQSGNVLFFASPAQAPWVLTRNGVADWSFSGYVALKGAMADQNVDRNKVLHVSGDTGVGLAFTANFDVFDPVYIGTFWRLDESDFSGVPLWTGNTQYPDLMRVRNNGRIYQSVGAGNSGPNAPTHDYGDETSGNGYITWTYISSGYGFLLITAVADARHATADVLTALPYGATQGGTFRWSKAAWSSVDGWPTNVALRDNSLVWFRDDEYWISNSGDFYNFEVTTSDNSSLHLRLLAPDGSLTKIAWALFSGVLILGTSSSEWIVRGPSPYDALTIANVRQDFNKTEGSRPHRPAVVDGGNLYIGASADRMHYAEYDRLGETLNIEDVTKFARHILHGRALQVVYQRDPNRLVWVRDEAGQLFCLTWYLKEQVVGWTRVPLSGGFVEQLGVIPTADASYSELWLLVRRQIGGLTRHYIEVMQPFFGPRDSDNPTAAGAWLLDSALRYRGAPVSAVACPAHLIGQTVGVFADGVELPRQVATGAPIALPTPAGEVLVGLPMKARIKTLSFDVAQQGTRARAKRANHVFVNVAESYGGSLSVNGGSTEPLMPDQLLADLAPAGQPRRLATKGFPVTTMSPNDDTLEIELVFDNAYPATVTVLEPQLEIGN